jgi:hypothetical protein
MELYCAVINAVTKVETLPQKRLKLRSKTPPRAWNEHVLFGDSDAVGLACVQLEFKLKLVTVHSVLGPESGHFVFAFLSRQYY